MNGQIISYQCLEGQPDYCAVEKMLEKLTKAQVFGYTEPEDPLCVYKDKKGTVVYLTGDDMTRYYRFVMCLTRPSITEADLALISTHLLRVYACVLLHKAGKDGPYIKLRLRWLSDCFEVYLRNTNKIREQHNDALHESLQNMIQMSLDAAGLDQPIHVTGVVNLSMDEVDDED